MTQNQAREQLMIATRFFMNAYDQEHGRPQTNAEFNARLDYINSHLQEYLPQEVLKRA